MIKKNALPLFAYLVTSPLPLCGDLSEISIIIQYTESIETRVCRIEVAVVVEMNQWPSNKYRRLNENAASLAC